MPSWGEVVEEVTRESRTHGDLAWEVVRKKYLRELANYTERDTILYATRWVQPGQHFNEAESIIDEDQEGFMEAVYKLSGSKLVERPAGLFGL